MLHSQPQKHQYVGKWNVWKKINENSKIFENTEIYFFFLNYIHKWWGAHHAHRIAGPTRALCGQSETTSHRLLHATSRVEAVIHTCQIYIIYICLIVLVRIMLNLIRYSQVQKLIIRCRDKVSIYASIPPWWVLLIEDNCLFPFSWLHFIRQTQRSKGNLHHSIQINPLVSKLVEPKSSRLERVPFILA